MEANSIYSKRLSSQKPCEVTAEQTVPHRQLGKKKLSTHSVPLQQQQQQQQQQRQLRPTDAKHERSNASTNNNREILDIREFMTNVDALLREDYDSFDSGHMNSVKGKTKPCNAKYTEENVPTVKNAAPNREQQAPKTTQMDHLKYGDFLILRSVLEKNELALETPNNMDSSPHDVEISKVQEHMTNVHSLLQQNYNLFYSYHAIVDKKEGETNAHSAHVLEEEVNAAVIGHATNSRGMLEEEQAQIDQYYQLGLVNMQTGNYRKARQLFVYVLFQLRIRGCATNDQVLEVRERLGDLWVMQFQIESAKNIYMSILRTMAERGEGPNWDQYEEVRRKLDDLAEIST